MRMQTEVYPVYKFNELSETAKDKVRSSFGNDVDYDFVLDDAATIADLFGLDIRMTRKTLMGGGHRYDPTVYWSGFWSQGDGACYEGNYEYKAGALKAVKAYAPQDAELHRIVKGLQDVQRKSFYRLIASCKHRGYYYHSGCMQVEVRHCEDEYRDISDAEGEVTQLLRDFADWIYKRLEEEYDYQTSDEAIEESCELNGYEFYEDGSIA